MSHRVHLQFGTIEMRSLFEHGFVWIPGPSGCWFWQRVPCYLSTEGGLGAGCRETVGRVMERGISGSLCCLCAPSSGKVAWEPLACFLGNEAAQPGSHCQAYQGIGVRAKKTRCCRGPGIHQDPASSLGACTLTGGVQVSDTHSLSLRWHASLQANPD